MDISGSGALNNPNDETYVAAQLESGELLVRIQFEGNLESYTVGGVKLDNGFNHLIKVKYNSSYFFFIRIINRLLFFR